MTTTTSGPERASGATRGSSRPSGLLGAFVHDYVRNPVNGVFLVLVPSVFVLFAADALTDAAALLGGGTGAPVQTASAGWAASFLAGVAMYFQVSTNRAPDRRLVLAGLPGRRLAAARLACGALVAVAVTVVACATLLLAEGGDVGALGGGAAPARVLVGTLLAALVYLGIGAVVGAVLPDPGTGSVVLLFVWILDVFFGPVLGTGSAPAWRVLPTHFVTLWTVDLPSGHAGRPGDLGWALVAVAVALVTAAVVVRPRLTTSRATDPRDAHPRQRGSQATRLPATRESRPPPTPSTPLLEAHGGVQAGSRVRVGVGMAVRGLVRTPAWWLLLAAVPAVFVLLAAWTTPHELMPVTVFEGGDRAPRMFDLADIHGGTMAPVAVASLAMVAGVLTGLQTRTADRRLLGVGFTSSALLVARVAPVLLAAATAVVATLVTAGFVFDAENWLTYAVGNLLLAVTYGLLGLLAGPVLGRVAGVFLAFLVPFVDVGLGQSPMLNAVAPGWAQLMPGFGSYRILLDGALTVSLDEERALVVACAWLVTVTALCWGTVVAMRPRRRPAR